VFPYVCPQLSAVAPTSAVQDHLGKRPTSLSAGLRGHRRHLLTLRDELNAARLPRRAQAAFYPTTRPPPMASTIHYVYRNVMDSGMRR